MSRKNASETSTDRQPWLQTLTAADEINDHSRQILMYRLLKLANVIETPFFSGDSVKYQISMNELRVLFTLAPMREAASHEISAAAGVHPMNVSRAVASLRRSGRLTERADPQNGRRKLLTLTAEGRKLYKTLLPHAQDIAGRVFAGMSAEEIALLSRLIAGMTERVQAASAPGPSDSPEAG